LKHLVFSRESFH